MRQDELAPLWDKLNGVIERTSRFAVASHIRPDGDAVGSSLALVRILKRLGKDVWWVMDEDPGAMFTPFYSPEELKINSKEKIDFSSREAIVIVDAGEWKRLGKLGAELAQTPTEKICIDHHPPYHSFEGLSIVDDRASSTTMLLRRFLRHLNKRLTLDIAEPIYLGLIVDTQNFHLNNTTEEAHAIAAECLRLGVNPEKVHEPVFGTTRFSRLRLMSEAYRTIEVYMDGKVGSMYTTLSMFERANADWWEDDGFCDMVRTIEGVRIGIYLREEPEGKVKVSWRSRDGADIAVSARLFGGGGHARAAGARIKGSIEEVLQLVLDNIKERCRKGEIDWE
ncbi:MAG: DHH family phosphoesterase [Candidatus Omnitrophota bacterium]